MSSFVSFYWSSDTCSLILKEQRVGFELWSEYQKLSQGSWAVCSKCGPWRIPTYPPGKDRNLKCLCISSNLLNNFAFSGFNNKNQSLVFSIFLFPSILLFILFTKKMFWLVMNWRWGASVFLLWIPPWEYPPWEPKKHRLWEPKA